MTHELTFCSDWPLWAFGLAWVAALALVVYLYRLERREAGPVKGAVLVALRLLLIGLLLLMLGQPAINTRHHFTRQRQIAVLIDDSRSMRLADDQASPAERLRWADALGMLAERARPVRPEQASAELLLARRAIGQAADDLNGLRLYRRRRTPVPADLLAGLSGQGKRLAAVFERLKTVCGAMILKAAPASAVVTQFGPAQLQAALPPDARNQWLAVSGKLETEIVPGADGLAKALSEAAFEKLDESAIGRLYEQAHSLADRCKAVSDLLNAPLRKGAEQASLAWAIDQQMCNHLDAESLSAVDRAGRMTRVESARRLLAAGGGDVLERLARGAGPGEQAKAAAGSPKGERFDVKLLRFARGSETIGLETLAGRSGDQTAAAEDATHLYAALSQLFAQGGGATGGSPGERPADREEQANRDISSLAGVFVLSDGRFNGPGDTAALAKQHGVPVWPIVIGSATPPTDAAVLDVRSPYSVFQEDTATVQALVKLDGLAGQDVDVQLLEVQADPDAPTKLVQSKRVRPTLAAQRQQVEFSFKPEHAGPVGYRVQVVRPGPGAGGADGGVRDVMPANDRRDLAMIVAAEPTKVLLVDGAPRWEYEYLRNLFLRDKSVLLQHICLAPALIADAPARPPDKLRYASVKLAKQTGAAQVDRLPRTIEELFAFDVIVLGDVPLEQLPVPVQRDLDRFVSERGGTLVLIAGKNAMPAEFAEQPLADLMPVAWTDLSATRLEDTWPFRVRPTATGLRSDILRLSLVEADNESIWERMPPATWRNAALTARAGATVLAFAQRVTEGVEGLVPTTAPEAGESELIRQDQIERRRPLMVSHHYGLGNVLFLAYDRTWQLRWKVGDQYHHKLWGQVLRWATASRLPAGTEHVKLGADKGLYRPGEPVVIRARLTREDYTPLPEASLQAEIVGEGPEPLSQRANLLPAATGMASEPTGEEPGAASRQRKLGGASQEEDRSRAGGPAEALRAGGPAGSLPAADGVYVATVGPFPGGTYVVSLKINEAKGLPADEAQRPVKLQFTVAGDDPVEIQELAAREPTELAEAGIVLSPSTAGLAGQLLGEPVLHGSRVPPTPTPLWSHWWLLALFTAVVTAEWALRKKFGLI